MNCGACGAEAVTTQTGYGRRDDCPDCDWYSWGGKPLASPETMRARNLCHKLFDPLWQDRHLTRPEAYGRLARQLGITLAECHFGQMQIPQLREAYRAARKIRNSFRSSPSTIVEPFDQYLRETK